MLSLFSDMLPDVSTFFEVGPVKSFREAGGYANVNLILETGEGPHLARILREHGPKDLETEALFLQRVALTGFPCPTYLTGRGGSHVFQWGDQHIALMPHLEGRISDKLSITQIGALGATLARLHLIDANSLPIRKTWWHSSFFSESLLHAKRRFGPHAVSQMEDQTVALEKLYETRLPTSIVHGDPWPGNVLFNGERLVAMTDWEETTIGFSIFDLAYSAVHGCLSEGELDPRLFDTLIASYQSVRELSPQECQCFTQAVRYVACTNYLWLLLKAEPHENRLDELWASNWYKSLELDRLVIRS